jgi:hypothetical protein
MRRRDPGLSGFQAYRPHPLPCTNGSLERCRHRPRLGRKLTSERGSESLEDFDPAFPGRSIQDCDSRYHILRTNVNTKFRKGGISEIRAPRSSSRSVRIERLAGQVSRAWTRNEQKWPLGKGEHHPARPLPSTQSIHDPIYIGQAVRRDLTVNFSLAG